MSADELELEGTVVEQHRGGFFTVHCTVGDTTRKVLARVSGRLYERHIKIVLGDLVQVAVSPYDLGRGRIVYRGRREERGR